MTPNAQRLLSIFAPIVAVLVIIAGIFAWNVQNKTTEQTSLGHGGTFSSINYAAIGTPASPRTLTNSYNGASSTVLLTNGMPNIVIGGKYTPKSYGSNAYILLERSLDGGSTFVPYQTLTAESSDVLVNTSGTSTTGTPFIVPGNNLYGSTSGTPIFFSFDVSLVADYIRISARETSTSTLGTIYVQSISQSN